MQTPTEMKTRIKVSYSKHAIVAFLAMVLTTYYFAWDDLRNNDKLTGNLGKDIMESIDYWFGWVLPYWWLIIIIGTFVLSLISYGVTFGIKKLITR